MRSVNTSMNRLVLGAVLALAMSGQAFAQGKKADAATGGNKAAGQKPADDKVDISDLENKYWAPKDTDFSVVQNRTFTKDHKIFLSLQYGVPTSDIYNSGSFFGLTANYFLTERHGLQAQYIHANLHPNDSISDLSSLGLTGVYPNHGQMTDYYSVGYDFVPFYAKMSVMGKKIMYFDMAITPTLGFTKYLEMEKGGNQPDSALTYGFDITQYYFFSDHWAFRVDWKNQWYTQKVVYYENTGGSIHPEGSSAGNRGIHDSILMFGATFYFGGWGAQGSK